MFALLELQLGAMGAVVLSAQVLEVVAPRLEVQEGWVDQTRNCLHKGVDDSDSEVLESDHPKKQCSART